MSVTRAGVGLTARCRLPGLQLPRPAPRPLGPLRRSREQRPRGRNQQSPTPTCVSIKCSVIASYFRDNHCGVSIETEYVFDSFICNISAMLYLGGLKEGEANV